MPVVSRLKNSGLWYPDPLSLWRYPAAIVMKWVNTHSLYFFLPVEALMSSDIWCGCEHGLKTKARRMSCMLLRRTSLLSEPIPMSILSCKSHDQQKHFVSQNEPPPPDCGTQMKASGCKSHFPTLTPVACTSSGKKEDLQVCRVPAPSFLGLTGSLLKNSQMRPELTRVGASDEKILKQWVKQQQAINSLTIYSFGKEYWF